MDVKNQCCGITLARQLTHFHWKKTRRRSHSMERVYRKGLKQHIQTKGFLLFFFFQYFSLLFVRSKSFLLSSIWVFWSVSHLKYISWNFISWKLRFLLVKSNIWHQLFYICCIWGCLYSDVLARSKSLRFHLQFSKQDDKKNSHWSVRIGRNSHVNVIQIKFPEFSPSNQYNFFQWWEVWTHAYLKVRPEIQFSDSFAKSAKPFSSWDHNSSRQLIFMFVFHKFASLTHNRWYELNCGNPILDDVKPSETWNMP